MDSVTLNGRTIALGEGGYLNDPDDWSRDVAVHLATADGINLSEQHWEVIDFLRFYYERFKIAPMIKILLKELSKKYGPEKATTKYLYELFPSGAGKQACKIAGLPTPAGCV
ncbi:MAG: TusE/DsrC/DsvC family sulfur relay protein [Nitrospirae bacterium]|nr:TusE/DsrC/DsvC family sulfur relay protein [Nitrospirota bacterium]NTW65340.1 TusE/DsrC/DsvC family sulfur relay protein [Nitrospirota bacterium]